MICRTASSCATAPHCRHGVPHEHKGYFCDNPAKCFEFHAREGRTTDWPKTCCRPVNPFDPPGAAR